MKVPFKGALVAASLLAFAPAATSADSKGSAPKAKAAAKHSGLVTMTPADLKWVPNPAAPDAVSMAVLWGDPAKGAHGAFHKFKAGFDAGLHSHASDMRIAVVSGTLIAGAEGEPEKKLPPGSYEFQPHGVKHVTKCDAASECVIFVASSGKFDFTPAGAKK